MKIETSRIEKLIKDIHFRMNDCGSCDVCHSVFGAREPVEYDPEELYSIFSELLVARKTTKDKE